MTGVLRVGLSGGIGSGKSTVAGRLAEHGAVVIDADALAREVVEPGSEGLAEVVATFGDGVLGEGGVLDRQALADRVFGDQGERAKLNGILHPRIGERTAELMNEAASDAVVVHDVPLLVENDLAPSYHLVIMVDADTESRLSRLVHARGISEEDARSRIRAQASEGQRREVADVWLDNSGRPDEILPTVDRLWADRLVPYEANVRLNRIADHGGPRLVEPDPEWPRTARRLAGRITTAGGGKVLRIDHIGSTAVGDLPAKNIVDLQVVVRSLTDAEEIGPAIDAAGFPHLARITHDNPRGEHADPEYWRKRLHAAADPGQRAILHFREIGSPGWRYALLIRDWLRAEPDVRDEYRELKQRLSGSHAADADFDAYTVDKEPWFEAASARAEEWARRSGWTPPGVTT